MGDRWVFRALLVVCVVVGGGCAGPLDVGPELGELYSRSAQASIDDRNPVVVIPGILGSKLADAESGKTVWGAFVRGAADPDIPSDARLIALPMEEGVPLHLLFDTVASEGALETVSVDVGLLRIGGLGAYRDILVTLGVGGYRDEDLGESGAIDYGDGHYTCFQFDYDWRRELTETVDELHSMILGAKAQTAAIRGVPESEVKVDVVAHSMGGLILRYYLRYGNQPLPIDGSDPVLDWSGAQHIERAIIVATPSAGSALAVRQLAEGVKFAPFLPRYDAAILGTFPSIYQLMPRTRHARIIDADSGEPIDLFDVDAWERYGLGLMDPDQMDELRVLLPDAADDGERLRIAREHLAKSLEVASRFHRSLDLPAEKPDGLQLILVAGDADDTADVFEIDDRGRVRVVSTAPGDDTVPRWSALMDERTGAAAWRPRLVTPVDWDQVLFLGSNHLGLTKDPMFTDNVLYILLEAPGGPGEG